VNVIGRTSTFALKGARLDTRQLGDTLHVATLVEGSLRRTADGFRMTVRLLNASTGYQLWAGAYEGTEDEVGSLENAAVREIARALHVDTTRTANPALAHASTASMAARDAYLRGRFLWQKRSAGSLRKAIQFYGEATAHDPNFARAYAGIADAYTSLGVGNLTDNPPDVYFDSARTAAERALALDGGLAEAHASLGQIQILYALDWPGGTQSLARAQAIDSTYPAIYEFRTELYEWRGEGDSAVAESERGLRLDPLSLNLNVEGARALFFARRYDDALTRLRRTQELDPNFPRVYMVLGEVYSTIGRHADAIRALQHAISITSGASRALSLLGAAYATAGNDTKAREVLAELERRAKTRYVPALDFAIVQVGRDDRDEAFKWLNRAYDDHSIRPYITGPEFDRLRSDPRYALLLTKLRLTVRGVPITQ
jgi:tetratricopeptide (TPR) repeat protein